MRKQAFLNALKSKGKNKYNGYKGLPLRYAGGKTRGVGHIIEHIPEGINTLVSPFFGGGAVEIACAKELCLKVKGYDIFNLLVNYWNFQINHPIKLANKILENPLITKEIYYKIKEKLRKHWKGEEFIEDQLSLAAYYWLNHNLSYGPMFLGWISNIYKEQKRYYSMTHRVKNFKCPKLSVECEDFTTVIPRHSNDFLYCDPPYYLGEDSKMFSGIYPNRNFAVHHNTFNHIKCMLKNLLHQP